MLFDGFSSTTALVPSLGFAAKAFEIGYQFADVPKQTQEVLEIIKRVKSDIRHARELRRRKSGLLEAYEKAQSDETIESTHQALCSLEELVESPRADMMANFGKVRVGSRLTWVLRDANNVSTALIRLDNVAGALNREIAIMRCRGSGGKSGDGSDAADDWNDPSPPPYDAAKELMHFTRQLTRRGRDTTGHSEQEEYVHGAEASHHDEVPDAPISPGSNFHLRPVYELPAPEPVLAESTMEWGSMPAHFPPPEMDPFHGALISSHSASRPLSPLSKPVFMETQTLIPGRREPLLLRWKELYDPVDISRMADPSREALPVPNPPMSWMEYQASRLREPAQDM